MCLQRHKVQVNPELRNEAKSWYWFPLQRKKRITYHSNKKILTKDCLYNLFNTLQAASSASNNVCCARTHLQDRESIQSREKNSCLSQTKSIWSHGGWAGTALRGLNSPSDPRQRLSIRNITMLYDLLSPMTCWHNNREQINLNPVAGLRRYVSLLQPSVGSSNTAPRAEWAQGTSSCY